VAWLLVVGCGLVVESEVENGPGQKFKTLAIVYNEYVRRL
jgi:hypothetical protein